MEKVQVKKSERKFGQKRKDKNGYKEREIEIERERGI